MDAAGTRFVEVVWPKVANSDNHSWDVHVGLSGRMKNQNSPMLDAGLSALIADLDDRGGDLISIAGAPPDLVEPPGGCRFAPRCPFARGKCSEPPPLVEREAGHWAACHFAGEAEAFRRAGRVAITWERSAAARASL